MHTQPKGLIQEQCANYLRVGPSAIKNYCWMKEKSNAGVCVIFTDEKAKCRYFEEAVLPLDEDLKERTEEKKNVGLENRTIDSGSGPMQGAESEPGNPPKVSVKRVSVDQHRRPGLLSRTRVHGMAFQEPKSGR